MRAIITSSTLIVTSLLIILIHCTIIGNNVRNCEVSTGLKQSMEYAYDKMMDMYIKEDFYNDYNKTVYVWYDSTGQIIYKSDNADELYNGVTGVPISNSIIILDKLITCFCDVLQSRIDSDGEISIQLLYVDIETGTFQIRVTEYFKYPFMHKEGQCMYEKTCSLY